MRSRISGSSNGTFVNGLRIQSPRVLALGDSIETGATTLVVREIVRPQAAKAASEGEDRSAFEARAAPTVFARSPVVEEASQTPPPALKLEIDFDAREARIALGDDGETVRLIFEDGVWRASTAGPDSDQ